MTASPKDDDDRALDAAVEWMITLGDAPADPDLRARFEDWLAADAAHATAWTHASRVSGLLAKTGNVVAMSGRPASRRRFQVGALAALAACIALFLAMPTLLVLLRADYRTGTAERKEIHLADGSTAWLAPHSAVAVAFSGSTRRITLLSGEAYFEVAHNAAKPFSVTTGQLAATDIGTGFEVTRTDDGGSVAVRHGAVRVNFQGGSHELHAGDWTRLASNTARNGHDDPALVGSWTGGKLAVIDRPLGQVLDDIRPYYRGFIIVSDTGLSRQSVTGSFDLSDPVGALQALARPHGAQVRQITPWLLVVSPS